MRRLVDVGSRFWWSIQEHIVRMRAWSTMKALMYNRKRLEVLIRRGKVAIDGRGVRG